MRAQGAAVKVATEIDVGERHSSSADSCSRSLRVVALGGGTGLPLLLGGLRAALFPSGGRRGLDRARQRLTAIVTAADDGGSSGRLRRAYRVSPPGDIRNCLLALSDGDPTLAAIFNFRFNGHDQQEVGGHSLGNLILTALSHLENDFVGAVERANHILGARGRVFPATLEDVRLLAEFSDGSWAEGESQIASVRRRIRQVRLAPRARVVLVMNLMTEPGETDGTDARGHLLAVRRHAPLVPVHDVLLNVGPIPHDAVARYAAEGAVPIAPDVEGLRALGTRVVGRNLLAAGPKIRHDPQKLARAVLELAQEARQ